MHPNPRRRFHFTLLVTACLLLAGPLVFAQSSTTKPTGSAQPQSKPASQPTSRGVPFQPITRIEKRGNGPITLVLIPGLSCDWTVFDAFMSRNADKYTMYAVTLPGFGDTEPPQPADEDDFGAWLDNADKAVWKIVVDNKLAKPVIVGHSLGGHLALRLGEEHAADLRAVVSIDGAPAFPFGTTPASMTKEQRLKAAAQMAGQYLAVDPKQWAATQKGMMASMITDPRRAEEIGELCSKVPAATTVQYLLDLVAADIRDQLPQLTCPTLVTPSADGKSEQDTKKSHDLWKELLKGAPNVKFAFFDDTRHFIQDDRPRELDEAISDFLAGRDPKGFTAPPAAASQPETAKPPK